MYNTSPSAQTEGWQGRRGGGLEMVEVLLVQDILVTADGVESIAIVRGGERAARGGFPVPWCSLGGIFPRDGGWGEVLIGENPLARLSLRPKRRPLRGFDCEGCSLRRERGVLPWDRE
jgi:hypothetical protein